MLFDLKIHSDYEVWLDNWELDKGWRESITCVVKVGLDPRASAAKPKGEGREGVGRAVQVHLNRDPHTFS